MPSEAYESLNEGLEEVTNLLRGDPTPRGRFSPDPDLSRALLRSAVVLLCSHFERYLRLLNEESVILLNNSKVDRSTIPERFSLQHSRFPIDEMANTQWTNRSDELQAFVSVDAWLWGEAERGELDHSRIGRGMKSPMPDQVIRLYRNWGIEDIFDSITRKPRTRRRLFLKLTELVEKRHNIAHGDFSEEASAMEVREYQRAVKTFCGRLDRKLATTLRTVFGINCTWY
jgi:hypothetical protein